MPENIDTTELTPMMLQYLETKKEHTEEIIFFRLGDFYEMFFEDAKLVSRELSLTLTSRRGDKDKTPMCGIPYHAAESYITKLINLGHKVAIVEQIGDPKAKGLTKREVIKVITPGTVLNESALGAAVGTQNNYLALIYEGAAEENKGVILVAADASTGECAYGSFSFDEKGEGREALFDELYRLAMPELMLCGEISFEEEILSFLKQRLPKTIITRRQPLSPVDSENRVMEHFSVEYRPREEGAVVAVAALLEYLHETIRTDLSHINRLTRMDNEGKLVVDSYSLRNLEVTRNLRDGGKRNTLFAGLDFTGTAMGARRLKKWLEEPLLDKEDIESRLDAVEALHADFPRREAIREKLKGIYDFERLLTRIEVAAANARDLVALKLSLRALPGIKEELAALPGSALLAAANGEIELYGELADLIDRGIVEEPGISLREGGIIKSGYNAELDEYRRLSHDSKSMLQEIEERERQATGIRTLKIGYNKVFGYYIEIRNTSRELVPDTYIRKQTLVNAERYITEELKDFETRILGAQEKIVNLEYNLFSEIREAVRAKLTEIQRTARAVGTVDALNSLAIAAAEYNYVRPRLGEDGAISIVDGRHPLVERLLERELFVPNDAALDHVSRELVIITGPNMAGKSTYMRQVAIITLMAQAGSFVPAREARISPVDRIFTRIGASDDLASGQSTFMVEMNEVAHILKYATGRSLIILDEIGRGTSTYDGMSIARAVIEYIRDRIHAKTLFATHYHELTELGDTGEGKIVNACVAVKERGSRVDFLRRIVSGAADKSYGIHVARLAGLPKSVTSRAEKILADLESNAKKAECLVGSGEAGAEAAEASSAETKEPADYMGSLFTDALREELLKLDVMTMTPLEAMNALYRLQEEAKKQ